LWCGIPQKKCNKSIICCHFIILHLLFVSYKGLMLHWFILKHVAKPMKENISCVLTDDLFSFHYLIWTNFIKQNLPCHQIEFCWRNIKFFWIENNFLLLCCDVHRWGLISYGMWCCVIGCLDFSVLKAQWSFRIHCCVKKSTLIHFLDLDFVFLSVCWFKDITKNNYQEKELHVFKRTMHTPSLNSPFIMVIRPNKSC
jgi:hypothetical protein